MYPFAKQYTMVYINFLRKQSDAKQEEVQNNDHDLTTTNRQWQTRTKPNVSLVEPIINNIE